MDEGGTNPNGSKLQGAAGQVSATSVPNPVMRDFVSDWSPVHDASIHGRLLALQNLIKQGSDVNLLTADQVSPLHEACLGGHAACARLLLKHGAQVDAVTVDWHTPLFSACASGSVACLAVLLQHGASLHPPCDLASPLHEAARRGANVNSGKGLDSPLHAAARSCSVELVTLLLDFGADVWGKNAESKRPMELVPPSSPVGRLLLQKEGPLSLMQLCRLCIRRCFGHKQHQKVAGLLLPDELKQFLLHA
ncbi:ankyrin repeat and SOCS box protein 9 isoform X2 [Dryobates pubescens]|uniref:ankyrin repeat and SOCS box protein 9 isoform X2 n=1 Tax=Dryobates pubescens TaxID=118200 RepID=UPI0023B99F2E|nr:ankyrin repeat and SOCS box protein 9 isoform X2 [Dryobates pubescens]